MKNSSDHSLFTWTAPESPILSHRSSYSGGADMASYLRRQGTIDLSSSAGLRGLLANSPTEFALAGNVIPFQKWEASEPYSTTNRGLRMTLPIAFLDRSTSIGILQCHMKDDFGHLLGIPLCALEAEGDQFARYEFEKPHVISLEVASEARTRTIFVRNEVLFSRVGATKAKPGFFIRRIPVEKDQRRVSVYKLSEGQRTKTQWDQNRRFISSRWPDRVGSWAVCLFFEGLSRTFAVLLGYGADNFSSDQPCCQIKLDARLQSIDTYIEKSCGETATKNWDDGGSIFQLTVVVKKENSMPRGIFLVDIHSEFV
jgi:hypothetical protein